MHQIVAAPAYDLACAAMAEHFLDSDNSIYAPITALACVEAGLSLAQAEEVWWHEVCPVLCTNLWATAGQWGAWNEQWLHQRILAHRCARAKPLARILAHPLRMLDRLFGLPVLSQWRKIAALIIILSAIEPAERRRRVYDTMRWPAI